jgi:2'-5' RNA ligase
MQCLKSDERYGVVYLSPPQPLKDEIVEYSNNLLTDGRIEAEKNPHITILYGIKTNDVREVTAALGEFHPIRVMFGKTSMFMADDINRFDIVKIDVFGLYLARLRKRLMERLDNKQTYSEYFPHITLGAVKANYAIDYVGNNPFIGAKFVGTELIFSPAEGEKTIIYAG